MTKRKPSTPAERKPLAPAQLSTIPRDPEKLAKFGETILEMLVEHEQKEAAWSEAKKANDKANKPRKPDEVTKQDVATVNHALQGLVVTMMATGRLAYLGRCGEDSEAILTVIRETVRRSASVVDACVARLGGIVMGVDEDALEDDD